ncbi:CoA transferase [Methylobacterium terricola]|uniref:CoA transferase n=1 Tax=Methylobacterium terricola TaxID=2583531 RepID=A0A5C4LHT9_9HYPH|nr:CoA transferase [Methylobacterium terricola]TNC12900.1 CoA transferase [Methylobacterium terricola]
MPGPLAGIRVVDVSTVVAGPFATQVLAEMGADVLKVEGPAGDILRAPGPARSPGMGAAFLNCNRGKRGLVLDLKQPADRARLDELVRDADILVHNMRMKAAGRLGLDDARMRTLNPGLITCAIVGFGQDGPYRDRPAYDDIIQAACGWADLERRASGEPRYAPTIAADKTTSLYVTTAIAAALFHRACTGEGQAIEVPMFESMVSFLAVEHLAGLTFRPPLGPSGYARLLSRHRRPYRTRDGYIAVLPYNANHWRDVFRVAGRDAWAQDEALGSDVARAAMIDTLYERLAACLAQDTTEGWLARLAPLDVPCSRVNRIEDLLDDPHLVATGFFEAVDHPTEGPLIGTRPPVRFSRTPCGATRHAPPLEPGTP